MKISGSCHCGAVKFSAHAYAPVPYMRCYCSICRKTAGASGYAINLGAQTRSLSVEGEDDITVFHASFEGKSCAAERRFCRKCGSALWVFDPRWPDLIHPFASAIDSELPKALEHVHIMLGSKAGWVPVDGKDSDQQFDQYPNQSLADWHDAQGLSGSPARGGRKSP